MFEHMWDMTHHYFTSLLHYLSFSLSAPRPSSARKAPEAPHCAKESLWRAEEEEGDERFWMEAAHAAFSLQR